MQLIMAAEQSPDGRYVILAVQSVDKETEKKYSNLYLTEIETKKTKKFTNGKQSDAAPKWSSDGLSIIFLSNRDDEKQSQFYQIPTNGGEAQKISSLTGEIGDYLISSNGKTIYFQFRKKDQADIDREKEEQTKKLGIISREINRTFYRLDGYGYLPNERWHLWALNIEDGTTRQLTNHEFYDETDPFLSPDEKTLGFFSNRTPDPDLDHDVSDLYLLDLTTLEFIKMDTPEGPKNHGAFSPDGKWILYTGQKGKGQDWKNNDLWIIPADGSSPAANLTHQFDINLNGGAIPGWPIW
jgi:Tol biopolymer transport system component